jgi:hypothetical protein
MDHLAILSKTISDHAHKVAREEWSTEHDPLWNQIVYNTGLAGSTLEVDGRALPIEVITQALSERFLKYRVAKLLPQLTNSVVETAFRKVIIDEPK